LQFEYIQRPIIAAYTSYIPNLIQTKEGESLREKDRKVMHLNM